MCLDTVYFKIFKLEPMWFGLDNKNLGYNDFLRNLSLSRIASAPGYVCVTRVAQIFLSFPLISTTSLHCSQNLKVNSWLLRFDAAAPILHGIEQTTAHWKALDQSFLLSRCSLESVQGWLRGSQNGLRQNHQSKILASTI